MILTLCNFILIILILFRIPEKDSSSQNFNISTSLLGSPKNTDQTLQKFIWLLCLIFIILTSNISIQKI
jgi:protein translocase SecG subunit